jgi:hypothetical protein
VARRLSFKSYPLLKWALLVSAALVGVGLWQSRVLSADANVEGSTTTLLVYVGIAVALPFLSLLYARRATAQPAPPAGAAPHADTSKLTADQRQGVLRELEAARKRGELSEERFQKARRRLEGP